MTGVIFVWPASFFKTEFGAMTFKLKIPISCLSCEVTIFSTTKLSFLQGVSIPHSLWWMEDVQLPTDNPPLLRTCSLHGPRGA